MSAVLETNVTAEGTFILRLDQPWKFPVGKSMQVKMIVTEAGMDTEDPYVVVPERWASRTPAERAVMIEEWAESHHEGAGLSDWAVSRESIYD